MDAAVEAVKEKRDRASEPEDDDWDWREHEPAQVSYRGGDAAGAERSAVPRSIFSDVDD
jgi:hypothetical protein